MECILRAYRLRIDAQFDARHDLQFAVLAKFTDLAWSLPRPERTATLTAMNDVFGRWNNSQRFCNATALLWQLKEGQWDRGVRGNVLKESSRRMVNAAAAVVGVGVQRWK